MHTRHTALPRSVRSVRVVLLLLCVLSACRSFNVHSDWDEAVGFEGYQRFFWLEPPVAEGADPFADNSLLRKRIRTAVEANLTARGLVSVEDPANADFLVTYGVLLDEKLNVNSGGAGAYGSYGYGGWSPGFGIYGRTDVRDYQEATLVVDFLHPESEELVWRGWGSGFIQTRDRERGPERLEAGVNAVLDAFPPTRRRR
jgi:Domain of unknown function (DUF4136)